MGLVQEVHFSYYFGRTAAERRRIFLREKAEAMKEIEEEFRRDDAHLSRLERYCGKEARLYDSEKYKDGRVWEGLSGEITEVNVGRNHAPSPYALSYQELYTYRWREHYILIPAIRSIKLIKGKVLIDTEWAASASV